jgi:hypothetical protein
LEHAVGIQHASGVFHLLAVFLDFLLDLVRFLFIQHLGHPISYLKFSLFWPLAFGYVTDVAFPPVLNIALELSVLEFVQVCLPRLYELWGW